MAKFSVDIELNGSKATVDVDAENEKQAADFVSQYASTPDGVKQLSAMAGGAPRDEVLTTGQAAKRAASETLSEDLPGVGGFVGKIRNEYPEKIAEFGGSLGLEKAGAGLGAVVGTIGELLPKTGGDLALAGLAGPVLKGAGALAKKAAVPFTSAMTRIEIPLVERFVKRASQIAKTKILSPEQMDDAIKGLASSVKEGRAALGARLGQVEDDIAEKLVDRTIKTGDIGEGLISRLSRKGFAVRGAETGEVSRGLGKGNVVQEIIDDFTKISESARDFTGAPQQKALQFKDALALRRKIADVAFDEDRARLLNLDDETTAALKTAYASLNERLKSQSKRFATANDAFSKAASAYDDVAKALGSNVDVAKSRIAKMLRTGTIDYKVYKRLDKLAKGAADKLDNIADSLTAEKFAPIVNPQLQRALMNTGGGPIGNTAAGGLLASAIGGPKSIALGLGTVGVTSPRLYSAAIRGAQALPPATAGNSALMASLLSAAARPKNRVQELEDQARSKGY